MASNKHCGQEFEKIRSNIRSLETLTLEQKNSSNHVVAIAIKSTRIAQYLASDAVRRPEDKYAQHQRQQETDDFANFFCTKRNAVFDILQDIVQSHPLLMSQKFETQGCEWYGAEMETVRVDQHRSG